MTPARINTTNPSYFNGDTGRADRTVDDTEYLVYSFGNITGFSAKIYTWQSPISDVTFWASTNNGLSYTQVALNTGSKTTSVSPWGYYTVTNAGAMPWKTTNLKMQITATGNAWDPELSQISISHQ